MACITMFFAAVFICGAGTARGSETATGPAERGHQRVRSAGQIYSTAHVGYAMESSSSTGFRNAGGSMMIFDVTRSLDRRLDFGLRTAGAGAEAGGAKFYRMGAGPMIRAVLSERFALVAAGLRFQETGMAADDEERAYGSSGNALMISWERTHRIARRIDISWGGFVSQHWGGFQPSSGAAVVSQGRFSSVNRNVGMTRGIEFALRTAL